MLAQIALGGALGALARFGTQAAFGPDWPFGTLLVNGLGSFLMGVLVVWLAEKGLMRVAPFLMVGVLGAYTTFSTFSLDALMLWERGLPGQAAAYVGLSVSVSLAAVAAGVWIARGVLA
jgi:CrcB protein